LFLLAAKVAAVLYDVKYFIFASLFSPETNVTAIRVVLLFLVRWSLMLTGAASLLWYFGRPALPPGFPLCELPLRQSAVNSDSSVKAVSYDAECGAFAGLRSHVVLTAAQVDGRKYGTTVATFFHIRGDKVHLTWRTTRDLLITYPCGTEVEYLVAKESGVHITIEEEDR
jgi:hypothetical protein